ncbi:MAG TPA: hypothetical protein GYA08_04600 [Chloroflexi bacterium]|nr:hypothetical protein [Chloroflexota bacterium]
MDFVLILHNIMRWVVLVLAVYALVRMYRGLFSKGHFVEGDRKALSWFSISLDIQLLLGLVLYIGGRWWQNSIRFFAMEHIAIMIVAVVLAHLAVVFSKRAEASASKFKRGAIYATLAVLAVLVGIPWPFFSYGRPLLPALTELVTSII